jgi:hypothetical protein
MLFIVIGKVLQICIFSKVSNHLLMYYLSDSQTMSRGTILCRKDIENVPNKFQLNKGYV